MKDHVHGFFGLKPSIAVSKVMQIVKAKSSKWVNESGKMRTRFEWQASYGCFSYNHSHIDRVYKYIHNQETHHKKLSFQEEYLQLLQRFGIDYDERFVFDKPI